ncbi:hypothetical protein [Winogradskyella sp.]|uniref:hypothetical protein n=1 Tax=Winogradskyella sp. TaxID=1883156 RepID=UPI0025FC22E4|nr:hypothetical protein [Winogradskyella sp.]MCT4630536.1 hypothetical protein [Winogradskyella sp.]
MKSKPIHILLFFIIIMMLGCKKNNSSTSKSLAIPEGLVFNDGDKWVVNEATHIGMKRIDSILKNNTSLNGKVLGDAISKETSFIIKSCDMTGKAHDQLHVILVPILEETTDIKDVNDATIFKDKAAYIKRLVNTYFEYFKA